MKNIGRCALCVPPEDRLGALSLARQAGKRVKGEDQQAAENAQQDSTDTTFNHDLIMLNQKCLKLAHIRRIAPRNVQTFSGYSLGAPMTTALLCLICIHWAITLVGMR